MAGRCAEAKGVRVDGEATGVVLAKERREEMSAADLKRGIAAYEENRDE